MCSHWRRISRSGACWPEVCITEGTRASPRLLRNGAFRQERLSSQRVSLRPVAVWQPVLLYSLTVGFRVRPHSGLTHGRLQVLDWITPMSTAIQSLVLALGGNISLWAISCKVPRPLSGVGTVVAPLAVLATGPDGYTSILAFQAISLLSVTSQPWLRASAGCSRRQII